jgi:hypothetical protein
VNWSRGTHKSGSDDDRPDRMVPAITAAVLAVFAAFGSLLSGHAANEAILAQSEATDQWAFFQAKGTKEQIFDVGSQMVNALTEATAQADRTRLAPERLRGESQRYEREKEEIRREAETWEEVRAGTSIESTPALLWASPCSRPESSWPRSRCWCALGVCMRRVSSPGSLAWCV